MTRNLHQYFPLIAFILLAGFLRPLSAYAQIITTVAGNGTASYTGDGGLATSATLACPDDIAFDSLGNYYIADACNVVVRKVAVGTNIITTFAGTGGVGYTGDSGLATLATFNYPAGLAVDASDNVYISDFYNNVVRVVLAGSGVVTTFAGNGTGGYLGDGGNALLAELSNPYGLTFDAAGNLYIAEAGNNVVRKINTTTMVITTYAGIGTAGYSGDAGAATLAQLNAPQRLVFDPAGNLFIADPGNFVIREVATGTHLISTVAGNGTSGYSGDGNLATSAQFSGSDGIAIGPAGSCAGPLFITDDTNNRVRAVNSSGIVTTVIGTGLAGYSGDGGAPLLAKLNHPEALAFRPNGDLYLVDYVNNAIRKITGMDATCTFTPTVTNTATMTATETDTNTATETPSQTATNTATVTSTQTPTNTPTDTATVTATQTASDTATVTATNTVTQTATDSSTATTTNTATHTATVTPTQTATNTATITATQTATDTATNTATLTLTYTPTFSISMGKQVSKTSAQSGDTLTYSIGVTVTGGPFTGVVVTDTLPANASFVSIVSTSAGTSSFTPSTSLLLWTLPSPLAVGTYNLVYQTQVNAYVPADTALINGAQLTYTGLSTPLTSSVTVTTTGAYTVRVGIYNEAGELIESLWSKKYSQPIYNLTLSSKVITKLNGDGSSINLYVDGILFGVWDGRNAQGNPVTNGTYFIKVDNIDSTGTVTSVVQKGVVNRRLATVLLGIYNSAGELVRKLYTLVDDASDSSMTDVTVSPQIFKPGLSGGQPATLQIVIAASPAPVTLTWDGTADDGSIVTPGHYQIEAHWNNGEGNTSDIATSVMVTGGGDPGSGKVVAQPNLLYKGQTTTVFVDSASQSTTLAVKIYSLSGQLVTAFQGPAGTNNASWNATGMASGIYIAVVDILNSSGGNIGRQRLKMLVKH